jgi:RimJ/RimL family protein N-acetyltransferase
MGLIIAERSCGPGCGSPNRRGDAAAVAVHGDQDADAGVGDISFAWAIRGRHDRIMERPAEVLTYGLATLRRWRAADAELVFGLVSGSLEHLRPWMPWAALYTAADAADFTQRCEESWRSGVTFNYAITTDDATVGSCGLMTTIGPGGLEIGYWVHPEHTRRGVATAAAAAVTGAAFALPGIDRVEIMHDEANIASAGVPRKLGFTEVEKRQSTSERRAPGESGTCIVWRLMR